MIKRPTWILLIFLALTVGAYFYLKYRPLKSIEPTPTASGNGYLLDTTTNKLQNVRISDQQNHTTLIERGTNGLWRVTLPLAKQADQAQAEAAETQIGTLSIVTKLETSPDLNVIGLDSPKYIIKLTFEDGTQHTLEVGNLTPTSSGYYVRFDKNTIYVISQDGIDPLTALLTTPPYAATETPIPTLEPTATTEAAFTPISATSTP